MCIRKAEPIPLIAQIVLTAILIAGTAQVPRSQALSTAAPLPDFFLDDLHGGTHRYSALKRSVTVIAFLSIRCPMSNAFNSRLNGLYKEFSDRVAFVVIDSNIDESVDEVRHHVQNMGYDFVVYRDIGNVAADLLGAKATPDTFVIDQNGATAYHGFIEDAPNPERSKNRALRLAIEATLQYKPAPVRETHSLGCAIRRSIPLSR